MNENKRVCLIDNMATHYRKAIYLAMDGEFNMDWCFGEAHGGIKELDISLLKHAVKNRTLYFPVGYYIEGTVKLVDSHDVVITDGAPACISTWLLLLRNKIFNRKCKVYFWAHGWYGKEGLLKRCIKKIFFGMGSGVLAYSNYARDLMIKNGFLPDKIWVIHNSLNYYGQVELRNAASSTDIYKSHFENDNPVLIFIGRLTAVKRLDMLLDALGLLKAKGKEYNLVFVGDGVKKDELQAQSKELELEKQVWFYGACYDETTNAELIYNADLCVAPGNVGLTAMHTMVFGCPVATHNTFEWQMPEFEAIKEGETGCFFKQNDVKDIARSISAWFDTKHGKREEVRQACYKEIGESWNPNYQMEVLRKVVNNG